MRVILAVDSILIFERLNERVSRYKKVLLSLLIVHFSTLSFAATYYISNAGNDANTGLTKTQTWKTLDKINGTNLTPGDSILFKRGDSWFGQLLPKSGNSSAPVTYGAYGTGEKPLLHMSVNLNNASDWTEESSNIWKTTNTVNVDVGNIIFNNDTSVGVKKWNKSDILIQGDFWYDETKSNLYLYSIRNPASLYTNTKIILSIMIVPIYSNHHLLFENLAVKYGGRNGFHSIGSNNIIIKKCDIAWIGGGKCRGTVRFGNGIEFWADNTNCVVENCRIWEIYEAALTNKSHGQCTQSNITYRNNLIWNCEWSFEYYSSISTSITENIKFINNTCYNAGYGWSNVQRTDPNGRHICIWELIASVNGFTISNNIFYEAKSSSLFFGTTSGRLTSVLTVDYNLIKQTSGIIATVNQENYSFNNFAGYKAISGYDSHSQNTDPLLVDASNSNFNLSPKSPCIDSGDPTSPFDPDGTHADIGALYYNHTIEYKFVCEGANYNGWVTSGKYERKLTAVSGIDSTVTTYLTVNPKYAIIEYITIKAGEAYKSWTKSGRYTRNLISVSVCDSTVTTNLTIENMLTKPIEFNVFPNPSNGRVSVRFTQLPDAGSRVDILDMFGRMIESRLISGITEEFNLDRQATGLYLMKSISGANVTIQKLILRK